MQLKGGSGDRGGDWAFDGLRDRSGLRCAGGEQENFTRLQDGANAHGDGAARTLLTGRKEFCVVVQRFLAQDLQARAGADAGGRLIETNVAVTPDSQKLKVDASGFPDGLFVRRAVLIVIGADRSVGNVDVARVRSEEHTSELQSHSDLVCRLLLEKKNK